MGDGLKTVYVRVRDVNGNINGATTLDRDSIMLDAVGPTFSSVTINGGATSTTGTGATLSINATDAGSSVAGYQVSEDSSFTGMTTWESWTSTPQTASFTLSGGDGVKTVYVRVRDANGHINGATTLDRDTISLDQLAPVFSSQVVINSGATATNNPAVTLSINATDAGSSVAGYQVSEDSSFTGMTTWEPWTSTPQTDSFTLSGGDGPKTVYVRVKDANDHINGATTLDLGGLHHAGHYSSADRFRGDGDRQSLGRCDIRRRHLRRCRAGSSRDRPHSCAAQRRAGRIVKHEQDGCR